MNNQTKQGKRLFKCECGSLWETACRDYTSNSVETCPNEECQTDCQPFLSWPDDTIKVNALGNLIK